MRRIVIGIGTTLSGLVLLFAYPTSLNRPVGTATTAGGPTTSGTTGTGRPTAGGASAAASATGTAASGAPAAQPKSSTGTFVGTVTSTRYGNVQVQIAVTNGKITDAVALTYPTQNGRDQQLSSVAIPILQRETVQAQSASVDMVSGATYTSRGYAQSLQSAIDQAGL